MRQLLLSLFLCTLSLSVFGFSQSDLLYLQDFYGFAVQNSKPGDGGSNPEQSSEDENCDQPSNFVEQLYGEDIPKACKEANGKSPKEYCSCLKEKINTNDLLSDLMSIESKKTEDQKNKDREELKAKYLDQFKSAYEQMTYGETIQRHILNIPNPDNSASCSPEQLSALVGNQKKEYIHANKKFLELKRDELQNKKNRNCSSSVRKVLYFSSTRFCNDLEEKIKFLDDKLDPEKQKAFEDTTNEKINSPICFTDSDIDAAIKDLAPYKNKLEEDPSLSAEDKQNLREIENMILKLQKTKSNPNISTIKDFRVPSAPSNSGCRIQDMILGAQGPKSVAIQEAKNILIKIQEAEHKTSESAGSKPCEGDDVCLNFKELNNNVAKDLRERFNEDLSKQCITFAEFSLLKGIPNGDFFNEMLKSGDPIKFLKPDKKNNEKLNFLRSNPILSKLIQHSESDTTQSAFLKASLNNLSKKMSQANLSEAQRLKFYIDFLQNDLGQFNQVAKAEKDSLICNDIARNYVIIQTAEYLPGNQSDGLINTSPKLAKELLRCDKNYSSVEPPSGLESLTVDPLFTLGDPNSGKVKKATQEEYQSFLKANCRSRDGLSYEDYLAKNCKTSPKEFSRCRQDFLNNSAFSPINNVLQEEGVKPGTGNISNEELHHSVTSTSESEQFWSWWMKDIMPGLNNDPTGVFGVSSYQRARSTEGSIFNTLNPPSFSGQNNTSSESSTEQASSSASSAQPRMAESKTISNPGQVQPRFNVPTQSNHAMATSETQSRQPASLGTESARDNTSVRKPNIRPSSNDQWSSGTQSPQSTNSQDSKLSKAEIDKLAEDNSKLKDLNTSMAKKEAQGASGGSAQGGTVSGAVASSGSISAGSQSSFSTGGGSRSVALGESPEKKGNFNDALNNIHEKSPMTVLGGVIDPAEFKGPQQSAKDLIVDDPKKFEKLGEDPVLLEAFIKEKMKGMAIGESKIITIINASPNRPVPHMIFRIKAKADGSFDIQSVPSEVPVRVATLKSLIDQLPKR